MFDEVHDCFRLQMQSEAFQFGLTDVNVSLTVFKQTAIRSY